VTGVGGPAGGELLTAVEPENVTAGGVGFLVIAGLAVGTVFLLRSLNKQLKKVDFEEEEADEAPSDQGRGTGVEDVRDAERPSPIDESEEGPRSPER
jgi:hypothetical protein